MVYYFCMYTTQPFILLTLHLSFGLWREFLFEKQDSILKPPCNMNNNLFYTKNVFVLSLTFIQTENLPVYRIWYKKIGVNRIVT